MDQPHTHEHRVETGVHPRDALQVLLEHAEHAVGHGSAQGPAATVVGIAAALTVVTADGEMLVTAVPHGDTAVLGGCVVTLEQLRDAAERGGPLTTP